MIKELRLQKEREDEEKLLNAIHRQAKEGYYFEKGKNYLNNKKAQKKEFKHELIEDTLCFGLFLIAIIPMILLLVVLCY